MVGYAGGSKVIMKTFELVCRDRKSFYGKARVVEDRGIKTLYSYNTAVCKINRNGKFIRLWAGYSATTMWDNQKVGKE